MSFFLKINTFSFLTHEDSEGFDFENEEKGPALELYGTDLTLLASLGQLEECFGREQELLEMM